MHELKPFLIYKAFSAIDLSSSQTGIESDLLEASSLASPLLHHPTVFMFQRFKNIIVD